MFPLRNFAGKESIHYPIQIIFQRVAINGLDNRYRGMPLQWLACAPKRMYEKRTIKLYVRHYLIKSRYM